MKVSEAKEKICPFIVDFHKQEVPTTKDNGKNYPTNINCICGDCMAWECTKEDESHVISSSDIQGINNKKHDGFVVIESLLTDRINTTRMSKQINYNDTLGYCKRITNA